jgi:hypothetical protein
VRTIRTLGSSTDAAEPMPGIGPMTASLGAFADFFGIDPDLVQAAAERPADAIRVSPMVGFKRFFNAQVISDRHRAGRRWREAALDTGGCSASAPSG